MTASVFIAASLDGFIARSDGGLDWLSEPEVNDEDDSGFSQFMDSIDGVVMGRNTFDVVLGFGTWAYGKKPIFVPTHRSLDLPRDFEGSVEAISGEPVEIMARLRGKGVKEIYVDGGATIQSFLRFGLVTRLILTQIPIVLGAGIPLFGPDVPELRLRHVDTRVLRGGLVQSELTNRDRSRAAAT